VSQQVSGQIPARIARVEFKLNAAETLTQRHKDAEAQGFQLINTLT
jgi:hypothetical protein